MGSNILSIVGPTASGKTSLSIAVAKKFNGEIVSADSRQIYRGMTVGTAKALPDGIFNLQFSIYKKNAEYFSQGIRHYLIDIKDPDEEYTVADFKKDATVAIDSILERGKLPILVGGTGLYIKSVVENLDIPEIKADSNLRASIEKEIEEKGLQKVFERLIELDPEAAYVVDPKNPRRVVRALEVATITGKPFTAQRIKHEPRYDVLEIGINQTPEVLRERIDKRVDQMITNDLIEEVRSLIKKYGENQIAFDAIGYREMINYLNGKISLDEAVRAIKLNTWRFAKRQITWFKKDKNIHWVESKEGVEKLIREFLGT